MGRYGYREMSQQPTKAVDTRVRECIEIRQQLSQVGANMLLSDRDRAKLQLAMNAYVQDGTPSTVRVHIAPPEGRGPHARVLLHAHQPSGVVMEM
jgi:hypothetical protein